jgi:hypothetical protein
MPTGRSLVLSPQTSASPEEAAAIVAALERFMRATAPPRAEPAGDAPDGWRRAALLEGISRASDEDVAWMSPSPWINT